MANVENGDKVLLLREVQLADLPTFFEHQMDPQANYMAAFTVKDPADEDAFYQQWAKILANPEITIRSILYDDLLVGHIERFKQFGKPSVGFWLGRDYWGQGLATKALGIFLELIDSRPLYARAATDNIGSRKVLQKNGFKITGEDNGFAHGRGEKIREFIFKLEESP